ncbi:glycoside hydrolase family 27 protein [Reichenbachiella ulvae]|uniref:Alpha-galactosidase n=1 Tax=Reichenbachiella ulvae TaxID=2980104 RepID=A0ABT3D011_9BACT|nr:glycoside hydrolase family 27 protein [Reichenbachiella ulvae]MCV9389283.1 glycoside hydrolase family 27 protein [Reichenbachiella ulvae]
MSNTTLHNIAPTPPMGWNSWDCFSVTVTEKEVKQNADFIAKNLKPYGWEYVIVDLAWFAPGATHETYKNVNIDQLIDGYGRLIPDPEKFPSSAGGKGFKPLADYIHGLGLKFGIHIMRGIPVQAVQQNTPIKGTEFKAQDISYDKEKCPWYNSLRTLNFAHEGAQKYYDSIFELYASWDVDYIKADDVNAWHEVENSDGSPTGVGSPYRIDDIEGIRKAIDGCGHPMVLSISPGGPETTIINHLRNHANLWRISADFWDHWGSLLKQMERCANWAPFVTENHWPDADMLPLGYMPRGESGGQNRSTNFTQEEQITLMTLWCIFRSPLMFGGNLPECDDFTIELISNGEVLEVNQKSKGGKQVWKDEKKIVWTATLDGDTVLAVFNISDSDQSFHVNIAELGIDSFNAIRDLWKKEDLITNRNSLQLDIPAHGAMMLRIR